jgi:hypothetical protein
VRRFIASLPGKVFSNVVVLALLVPYFALGLSVKGFAQLKQLPGWAVVDFVNKKANGTAFGTEAAKSVANSLSKTGKYDVQSQETVARVVESINLTQPLAGVQNVVRVGSELKVQTIVGGEVVDYRVDQSPAGKQARVSMRVVAYDVASGLPVNGAAVSASSIVRAGDVADDVLINDAIAQAAQIAVDRVNQQTLPSATVLNTVGDMAIVNQGTRAGFKNGMQVIISRGRQQVASGTILDVDPDKSTMRVSRSFLGITPGDRVRAIFDVPEVPPGFTSSGAPAISKVRANKPSNGIVTTLLVLGLVAFLAAGSDGRGGDVIGNLVAEPFTDPTNGASIKLSWKPNAFAKGNTVRQAWQIYRSDLFDVPVKVFPGTQTDGTDNTNIIPTITFARMPVANFEICNGINTQSATNVPGVQVGRPYQYSAQLIFAIPQSDLPGGGGGVNGITQNTTGINTGTTAGNNTTGTTGTTATTGTTGLNTNATTGTTGTTGTTATTAGTTTGSTNLSTTAGTLCFFGSSQQNAVGLATAFNRPGLVSPANNATMQSPQTFTFLSVVSPQFTDVTVEYVIQLSSTINFSKNTFVHRVIGQRRDLGTLATDPIDLNDPTLPASILNARTVYWRIGARNVADNPGPVKDAFTGHRYIFSIVSQLTRPGSPPPPPSL